MRRVNDHAVRQREIIAQCLKLLRSEIACFFFSEEIRPASRVNKERITGEYAPWHARMSGFRQ